MLGAEGPERTDGPTPGAGERILPRLGCGARGLTPFCLARAPSLRRCPGPGPPASTGPP